MTRLVSKKVYLGLIFFNLAFVLLSGCAGDKRNALDGLQVSIQIPEGEQPDLFWYGVEKKTLRLLPHSKEPVDLDWQQGSSLEIELHTGDKIQFFAFDRLGHILAQGEAEVSEEKKVSILVHRVL